MKYFTIKSQSIDQPKTNCTNQNASPPTNTNKTTPSEWNPMQIKILQTNRKKSSSSKSSIVIGKKCQQPTVELEQSSNNINRAKQTNSIQTNCRRSSSHNQSTTGAKLMSNYCNNKSVQQQQQQNQTNPSIMSSSSISKQMLSARVKSIVGKLLESRGAELRRTLFSLRQIFQDDPELAAGFSDSDGLDCLMKLANNADQIHQNYILRALDQLIAYPSGMNGLVCHNEIIQWLYALISSQNRLVARTSIKLLLAFVEHNESSCLQFCRAIEQVDRSKDSRIWSNILNLFKTTTSTNNNGQPIINQQQQQQFDIGLLVDAMTLVNKTLSGILNRKKIYYDFVDALEEAGMESIVKKYSDLDAQLREQFKIYEQAFQAEEEGLGLQEVVDQHEEDIQDKQANASSLGSTVATRNKTTLTVTQQQQQQQTKINKILPVVKGDNPDFRQTMQDKGASVSYGGDYNDTNEEQQQHSTRTNRVSQQLQHQRDDKCETRAQVTTASATTTPTNMRQQGMASCSSGVGVDCNKSDESTTNDDDDDDDDYESANEKPNENLTATSSNSTTATTTTTNNMMNSDRKTDNKLLVVQTVNTKQHQATKRQHQLQLRQQPPPQYQRANSSVKQSNLTRGKQQRASISSCSSSDSYTSYGSGYASGSGNSTDHEHKQLKNAVDTCNSQSSVVDANNEKKNESKSSSGEINSAPNRLETLDDRCDRDEKLESINNRRRGRIVNELRENEEEKQEKEGVVKERDDDNDDDNGDTQLKQHLSELEQLTDELAKRDLFREISGSRQQNHAPTTTIKSSFLSTNKSSSSSVLSTSSDNSSSIHATNADANINLLNEHLQTKATTTKTRVVHQNAVASSSSSSINTAIDTSPKLPPLPLQPSHYNNNNATHTGNTSSRSMSTTPTNQAASSANYSTQVYKSTKQPSNNNNIIDEEEKMDTHARSSESTTHYTTATSNMSQHNMRANLSSSPSKSSKQQQQEPYYHNLFQWEQLVSKGVTRPLLINDLDFTDLRDEDDCDLLSSNSNSSSGANNKLVGRNQTTGEPLTINIPTCQQQKNLDSDSVDSGASTSSPNSANNVPSTPASAPPPLPPPPISPWFNTFAGSRPHSQIISSPSPTPYDYSQQQQQQQSNHENRDQSPANSIYSNYSRNSVCLPQNLNTSLNQQYNTLQPMGNLRSASSMSSLLFGNSGKYANKHKKTMKLFWKEVREDRSLLSKLTKKRTIWDEIKPIQVDTQKLEYLFESKAKDLLLSKSRNGLDGSNQRKIKITVLDAKRSNAINIGMTKLPPMRTIKSAILKMDSSIMNREGIEKILTTMMPSEEEKSRIIEAQLANPDTPLGTAEQFLLNLASISALEARLKLWAFQLDYAQIEKEVAEPLMDLKQAIEEIERSETFRMILGTLLAIGNFLNSTSAKGFQIDYLEKVPEVKDTVHKHSLLHHLCLFIQEKYDPELKSDLYSEFSAVNRASKVDYTEVAKNLKKMQQDCKASWDYLKIVAKHDGLANLMNTCGVSSSSSSSNSSANSSSASNICNDSLSSSPKSSGKLNNLSKLSMITTVIGSDNSNNDQAPTSKQLKTKVSDFLTDCAERIMVLMVIHRRVMNRFQKLLVYLGCPSHQIKQTQPQQILKIINEFALEYRTKRERVREMIMKNQQCQHHRNHQHNNHGSRWQLNRSRWAGSQQYIDSLDYHNNGRPCSVSSSCASSYANGGNTNDCSMEACNHANHHHHASNGLNINQSSTGKRPGSPSGLSQASNYSDYLFNHSCCNSRQVSVTPVPSDSKNNRRPHSMSISMYDLQQQQQQQQNLNATTMSADGCQANDDIESARQKDEQLRRLLGAGKSLEGTCGDLYQMSHWSTTMTRVNRHNPMNKQRAASIDLETSMEAPNKQAGDESSDNLNSSSRRQSSYYRYLHNNSNCQFGDESEQNSDEEILQGLVRTVTANRNVLGNRSMDSSDPGTPNSGSGRHNNLNKGAKNKILSRFSCDRKSLRRSLGPGLEMSNA